MEEETTKEFTLPGVNQAIAKLNEALPTTAEGLTMEQRIAQLKDECSLITITGVDDKDGYEAVDERRIKVMRVRTGIEKARELITKPINALKKGVDDYAKELTAKVVSIEEPLKAELARVDKMKEAVEAAKVAAFRQRIQARAARLVELGAKFDGVTYRTTLHSLDTMQVEGFTDEQFAEHVQKLSDEKAHKDRIAARERMLINAGMKPDGLVLAIEDELGRLAVNLADVGIQGEDSFTALLTKVQGIAEKERRKQATIELVRQRTNTLTALGMTLDPATSTFTYPRTSQGVGVAAVHSDCLMMNEEDWNDVFIEHRNRINAIEHGLREADKARAEAERRLKAREAELAKSLAAERGEQLMRIGRLVKYSEPASVYTVGGMQTTPHDLGHMHPDDWKATHKAFKDAHVLAEHAEKEAAQANEAEREARASDMAQFFTLLSALNRVEAPLDIKTQRAQELLNAVWTSLEDLKADVNAAIEDLS